MLITCFGAEALCTAPILIRASHVSRWLNAIKHDLIARIERLSPSSTHCKVPIPLFGKPWSRCKPIWMIWWNMPINSACAR